MKKQSVLKAFFGTMLLVVFTFSFTSSKDDSLRVKVDTIEVHKYPSVKIDTQEWMTQNLNTDKFRNGDPIPEARSESEWEKAGDDKKPAWRYYDNDPSNDEIYGKLYNWYAVIDPRGLAPGGWHVPSDKEWTVLTTYLGGKEIKAKLDDGSSYWYTPLAGGKMKSRGTQYWKSPNKEASNSSSFSGLPGGASGNLGGFKFIGEIGNWWSSSEGDTERAWYRSLYNFSGSVARSYDVKSYGLSVRCLRD